MYLREVSPGPPVMDCDVFQGTSGNVNPAVIKAYESGTAGRIPVTLSGISIARSASARHRTRRTGVWVMSFFFP